MAASLALTAGVVTAVVPASADPLTGPVGQLVLSTGSQGNKITYGADTQSLTTPAGACDLTTPAIEEKRLLGIQGFIGTKTFPIGFKDASIGVIETIDNSRSATLCNQVDAVFGFGSGPETLVLSLGGDLKFAGSPVLASKASLDLEVRAAGLVTKSKAQVQITARLGGVNGTVVVPTFTITQGSPACPAKDNENCQVAVVPSLPNTYFDTLVLRAARGSFSLEGGSDATAIDPSTGQPTVTATQPVSPKPTTFDLWGQVDEVFECKVGDSVSDSNTTVTYVGSVKPGECTRFGATLNVGKDAAGNTTFVQFLKPLDVDVTAQFVVDVDWKSPGTPNGGVTLEPVFVDFEVGDPNDTELQFCPLGFYKADGSLGITSLDQVLDDFEPDLEGKQFSCIGTRSATVSSSEVVTSDQIFLIGDANFRR